MNPTDGRRHSATGSSSIQDPSLGRGEGEGGRDSQSTGTSVLSLALSFPCWIRCEEFLYFGLDGLGDSAEALQDCLAGTECAKRSKIHFCSAGTAARFPQHDDRDYCF